MSSDNLLATQKANAFDLHVTVKKGRDLLACDKNGLSDPYFIAKWKKHTYTSKIRYKTLTPEWEESFTLPSVRTDSPPIVIQLKDKDKYSADDDMGKFDIEISSIREGETWHRVSKKGEVLVSIKKLPCSTFKAEPLIAKEYTVLLLKDKRYNWSGTLEIYDSKGQVVYQAVGKPATWGTLLQIYDATKTKKLFYIEERSLTIGHKYKVFLGDKKGEEYCEFDKKVSHSKYKLKFPDDESKNLTLKGSFVNHEYAFIRPNIGRDGAKEELEFATVAKKRPKSLKDNSSEINTKDYYFVSVNKGEDLGAVICSVIILDKVVDLQRSTNRGHH